jgi:hypothetical protein
MPTELLSAPLVVALPELGLAALTGEKTAVELAVLICVIAAQLELHVVVRAT